ncbi:MAG: (2Fe-2S)-binding protein [Thermoanaerobaculia bacterium]
MDDFDHIHPAVLRLKTICRCNNIKYRTIEKAILDGARTVREIAARTTATTGHCGGSCTPVVLDMISRLAPAERNPPATAPAPDEDAWWIRKPPEEK